jgi:hypothetical protein
MTWRPTPVVAGIRLLWLWLQLRDFSLSDPLGVAGFAATANYFYFAMD